MDRILCSSKDVGEEEVAVREEEGERIAETVLSRRSGRGVLLTLMWGN